MKKYFTLSDARAHVLPLGRTAFDGSVLTADWSGAGFAFRFSGSAVTVYLSVNAQEIPAHFLVSLDGVNTRQSFAVSTETVTFPALAEGEHTLRLVRLTECRLAGADTLSFTGIELRGEDPCFLAPPERKPHLIDFYGDSITCGWGVLAEPGSEGFVIEEEDASHAYAMLTAEALDAEYGICAYSGHGIVSNCHGDRSEPMKLFYPLATRKSLLAFDHKNNHPDAIVVALGTNDGGGKVSFDEFAAGAREFIDLIRRDYPDTEIFWIYGMMGNGYAGVLSALAKDLPHLHFILSVPLDPQKGEIGASGHPSTVGARRVADELIAAIREVLPL